jgi:micrococcal nuclease
LCGCSAELRQPGAYPPPALASPSVLPSSAAQPTSTPAIGDSACIPQNTERQTGKVTKITDGDTIHVDIDGQDFKVRYIGMNAPEDTSEIQAFGPEATEANRKLVADQTVTLIKDVSETDKYGRLLRYVLAGGVFVNLALVREGYARIMTIPPDVACSDVFLAAEKRARSHNLGLWR